MSYFKISGHMCAIILACLVVAAAAEAQPTTNQVQEESRAELRDRMRREAEDRTTLAALNEFVSRGEATAQALTELVAKAEKLATRTRAMLLDDDGKRLGLDDSAHIQFVVLHARAPIVLERAKTKLRSIEDLVTTFRRQRDHFPGGYVPPDSAKKLVEENWTWAQEALKQTGKDDAWLEAVIDKNADVKDLSQLKTLERVIADYAAESSDAVADSRLRGERQARPEGEKVVEMAAYLAELERFRVEATNLVRETKAELDRVRAESEMTIARLTNEQAQRIADLERQLAESQAARAKQSAHTKAMQEQGELDAEQIRLRQRCYDPAVQRLLAPFITEGYWQPGDRFPNQSVDKSPVSLRRIEATGALRPGKDGLVQLHKLGNHKHSTARHIDVIRPKWGYSNTFTKLTADEIEELKLIQSLLIELGPTLEDLRMLAP